MSDGAGRTQMEHFCTNLADSVIFVTNYKETENKVRKGQFVTNSARTTQSDG